MTNLHSSFFKILQNYLFNHKHQSKQSSFLIAYSGGLDSSVLLHLFAEASNLYSFNLEVAHLNYSLRAKESDLDAEWVKKQCLNYSLKLHTKVVPQHFWKKFSGNLQAKAREIRYQFFLKIMQENALNTLVTAHHAQDCVENFLMATTQGKKSENQYGIPLLSQRNGHDIFRPLIDYQKSQIQDYAKSKKLEWREDSSNAKMDYLRNEIRHKILNPLQSISENSVINFQSELKQIQEAFACIRLLSQEYLSLNQSQKTKNLYWLKLTSEFDAFPLILQKQILLHFTSSPYQYISLKQKQLETLLEIIKKKNSKALLALSQGWVIRFKENVLQLKCWKKKNLNESGFFVDQNS